MGTETGTDAPLPTGNACIVLQDMIGTQRKCLHPFRIEQDILTPVKPLRFSLKVTREKELILPFGDPLTNKPKRSGQKH